MKWAAAGFVGGFLLRYLLVGTFRSRPPIPGPLTKATSIVAWLPALALTTNIQLPEVRIVSPDQRVEQMPGMPSDEQPGYLLDLITPWPKTTTPRMNVQFPEVRIVSPDRWVEPMPGVPSKQLGNSLDLIDTHYQLPQPLEKP